MILPFPRATWYSALFFFVLSFSLHWFAYIGMERFTKWFADGKEPRVEVKILEGSPGLSAPAKDQHNALMPDHTTSSAERGGGRTEAEPSLLAEDQNLAKKAGDSSKKPNGQRPGKAERRVEPLNSLRSGQAQKGLQVVSAHRLFGLQISYPDEAIEQNSQGEVLLKIELTSDAQVTVRLHESSGYRALDRAALKGVKSYTFSTDLISELELTRSPFLLSVRFELK